MRHTLSIEFWEEGCIIRVNGELMGDGDEYGTFIPAPGQGERFTPKAEKYEKLIEAANDLMAAVA